MAIVEIAGLSITSLGAAANLGRLFKDFTKWDEKDLQVDQDWLGLALQNGHLDGDIADYGWMGERQVPSAELRGSHSVVIAVNKDKRVKYRICQGTLSTPGGRNILVRKVAR